MTKLTIYILFGITVLHASVFSQTAARFGTIDSIRDDSVALQSLNRLLWERGLSARQKLEVNFRIINRANTLQKYDKSVAIANESIVLAAKDNLDSLEAVFTKLLGVCYYYMDRKRASVPYFEKALAIAERHDYWELAANCYNNIGGALADVQDYPPAEKNLLASLKIMKAHGNENSVVALRTYRVLARVYSESGREEKAEPLYLALIEKGKALKDTSLTCFSLLFYSEILGRKGQHEKALAMSGEAMEIFRRQKNASDELTAVTLHAQNLSSAGKHMEAYELMKESTYMMRNVFAGNLEKQVSEMEVKYKTAQIKKEKEITEIKSRKQLQLYLLSFAGVLIVLIAGSYIFIQRRNHRQNTTHLAQLAEIEKQRFKEVIEAEEKERSRIARELHDGLGQLLSTARLHMAGMEDSVTDDDKQSLDTSLKLVDEACAEVRNISHNMMPNALIQLGLIPAIRELVNDVNSSKEIRINFMTNIEGSLGMSLDITIYRVVQEILNNMIKHARANLIEMRIEKNGNRLMMALKDNGVGFNKDELGKSKGAGWKNIFSRISMLNGSIELESEPHQGTAVYINLELKNG